MAYHLVRMAQGPAWSDGLSQREQRGWDAHAAYLDRLADHGIAVLGGPIGEGDGPDAVLVIDAYDASAVRALLAADPWAGTVVTIISVEPWSIWLRARAMEGELAS